MAVVNSRREGRLSVMVSSSKYMVRTEMHRRVTKLYTPERHEGAFHLWYCRDARGTGGARASAGEPHDVARAIARRDDVVSAE